MEELGVGYGSYGWRLEIATSEGEMTESCMILCREQCLRTLRAMENLAITLVSQGQWQNLRRLEEKKLEFLSGWVGERHSKTLATMEDLATTYSVLGR